jgi:hypothetical protein
MHIGARRFGHGDREEVLPVDYSEIGGCSDAFREAPEDGHGRIAEEGLDLAREPEHGEPEAAAAIGAAPYQAMLLEGDD